MKGEKYNTKTKMVLLLGDNSGGPPFNGGLCMDCNS